MNGPAILWVLIEGGSETVLNVCINQAIHYLASTGLFNESGLNLSPHLILCENSIYHCYARQIFFPNCSKAAYSQEGNL